MAIELAREVFPSTGIRPGERVSDVELPGLALEPVPVLGGGVHRLLHAGQHGPVSRLQVTQTATAALFQSPHVGGLAEAGQQVIADLLAQEGGVAVIYSLLPTTATATW